MAKRRAGQTNAERILRENIAARLGDRPQRVLAEAIDVEESTLSDMLSGRRSISPWHYDAIAEFFHVEIHELWVPVTSLVHLMQNPPTKHQEVMHAGDQAPSRLFEIVAADPKLGINILA